MDHTLSSNDIELIIPFSVYHILMVLISMFGGGGGGDECVCIACVSCVSGTFIGQGPCLSVSLHPSPMG